MALLGWGKCRVIVKDNEGGSATYTEFPTPVENSTVLNVTKGDKKEAKVEGGENEDVRYNRNNYTLNTTVRAAKGRKKPIADTDGIVAHKYEVFVVPEDPTNNGIHIKSATVSIEDGFSTDEGGYWAYAFDALKPSSGTMLEWGVITVTETGESITKVAIATS